MNQEKIARYTEDFFEDLLEKASEIIQRNQRPANEVIMGEREVLKMLQISKRTLATLRAEGILSYSKVRGILFYRLSDILEMIEKNEVRVSIPKTRLFKNNL
jgi:hypothetical protein